MEELDRHEKDMKEMLQYLSEVEGMFHKGNDLKEIRSMMDITKENLDQQVEAITKLHDEIKDIEAIGMGIVPKDLERSKSKSETVLEGEAKEDVLQTDPVSQEESKMDIV